ncbi:hypothetical protein ACFCX4_32245 [Kitasatospora sp. NPDC056327]|uniref:hypothetical protein n=1 Tax=Kitasatospora sp. NPDC056327 TaxID=3345785 RepID=UPI0035E01C1E
MKGTPAPASSAAVAPTASAAPLPVLAVLGELRPGPLALGACVGLCALVGRRSRPSAAPPPRPRPSGLFGTPPGHGPVA